jgi:hypothetical protein
VTDERSDRWLVGAAFACALLVFLPMLGHTFYRDDFRWVERAIDAAHHPAGWFTLAGTDFRPLASLSFILNLKTSGLSPAGYYGFNLLLHLANVALLMGFVHRLSGGSLRAAGIAGLLFGTAFANYGEAVYWICGRTGPIADFFMLATLLAHWDGRARGATGARILAWTCFALALLAKETAAVLLPLLAVLEWAHPARRGTLAQGLSATARRLAPYAAMTAVYVPFQFLVWRAQSPILESEWTVGPHVLANLLEYAVRMFLPITPSSMMVPLPAAAAPALGAVELALSIVLPLAWMAALVSPLPRATKFALWWIPLTILPVAFFTYRTSTRYLYTPSMGVAMLAGMGLAAWTESALGGAKRARAIAAITALAIVLVVQGAVMGVILRRHHELERREAPEEWARLRAHARAAGMDAGP